MKILHMTVGEIYTNCYIVYDEDSREAVVIDPGDNGEEILERLRQENLILKYILLTHGHYDHILGVHAILSEEKVPYVVPEEDFWLLNKKYNETYVADNPDIAAVEGTEIHFGNLTACYMHTPGHTPGSSVIRIGDSLFTGDTLFRFDCGRCDLKGSSPEAMVNSLTRLYHMEGNYQVYPGHDAFSTLDEERQGNPYMKRAVTQGTL